jgi:hypothetical protein
MLFARDLPCGSLLHNAKIFNAHTDSEKDEGAGNNAFSVLQHVAEKREKKTPMRAGKKLKIVMSWVCGDVVLNLSTTHRKIDWIYFKATYSTCYSAIII